MWAGIVATTKQWWGQGFRVENVLGIASQTDASRVSVPCEAGPPAPVFQASEQTVRRGNVTELPAALAVRGEASFDAPGPSALLARTP
jgi:hypothetical protein